MKTTTKIVFACGLTALISGVALAESSEPLQTKTVDACESFSIGDWWIAGTEMSVETSPESVKEGKGSLKIVYPVNLKARRWIGPTKHSVNMEKPEEIIFWVKPEESSYVAPQLIDSDGTQLGKDIKNLKPGEWNLVSIRVKDMGMSKKGKDGVLSDLKRLTFAVHASKGFAESKDYVYYFDNIVMVPVPLKAIRFIPKNGTKNVQRKNITMIAEFSEAVSRASLKKSTVKVIRNDNGSQVECNISSIAKKIFISPKAELAPGIEYTIVIEGGAAGIKDSSGRALQDSVSWNFTTTDK